jgi:hypothetical protein
MDRVACRHKQVAMKAPEAVCTIGHGGRVVWSCSTTLLRYLHWRRRTRRGKTPSVFSFSTAAGKAGFWSTLMAALDSREGSIAKSGLESGRVEVHANHSVQSVQRSPVPRRGGARCRAFGRTRCGRRSKLYLALGPGLRSRIEQTLPDTSEAHQQKLPH